MSDMIPFDFNNQIGGNLPAHLQGSALNVNAGLLATLGQGGNRIGLKGNRFRLILNGKEERVYDENYLDCIIVGVVPNISRMYFDEEYDQSGQTKQKPACFSKDGNKPTDDAPKPQNDTCNGCKWDVKGSKIVNGQEMKACGFFQRLVVKLAGDASNNVYRVDVKSQGLFGNSKAGENKYNIRDYGKFVQNRGADASQIITRLSFDTDSSVPKLLFSPVGFVSADDYVRVCELVGSAEVARMLEISAASTDLTNEENNNAPAAPVEKVTPAAPVEKVTPAAPVQQAAPPKPAPAPVPAPAATKTYRGIPEKLGVKDATTTPVTYFTAADYIADGWTKEQLIEGGYVEEVVTAPVQPAAPPKPPTPAKPASPPKPPSANPAIETGVAVPPVQQTRAAAPAQQTGPVEVGSTDDLEKLLNELA